MVDFKTLQLNPLLSYKTSINNSITIPINLSPDEIKIFEIFKEIIKENNLKNIELRVVGGWVRDHLLNIPSNDLDIIIKGIDPNAFVKLINEKVYKDKYILINNTLKKPNGHEIKLIKTILFDIVIDFVELKESLIENAKARDFTFNSLFYNILENQIEDILNMGISDLKNGLIRTCATSNEIIDYNSLPILRMIRFALKYNFIIDDECFNEIEKKIHIFRNNLLYQVKTEAINKDLNLIFCGPNPSFAIYLLYKLGLLEYVLQLELHYKNARKNLFTEKDILNCVNIFIVGVKILDKYKHYFEGENYDNKYKYSFYSFLLTILMKKVNNKYDNNLARMVLSNALKIESKNSLRIIYYFDDFNYFFVKSEYNRLNVGSLLKKMLVRNISQMILISVSYQYVKKANSNEVLDKLDEDELEKIFKKYYEFYIYMKKENLEKADEIRPIMDAKQIIKEFPGTPKHYFGEIIEAEICKQIESNNNISKEDIINVIKDKIQELNEKFKNKKG